MPARRESMHEAMSGGGALGDWTSAKGVFQKKAGDKDELGGQVIRASR